MLRKINQELAKLYSPRNTNINFINKWKNRKDKDRMIRCVECGKRIWSDVNLIQRHYLFEHQVEDRVKNFEKKWKIQEAGLRNTRVC